MELLKAAGEKNLVEKLKVLKELNEEGQDVK